MNNEYPFHIKIIGLYADLSRRSTVSGRQELAMIQAALETGGIERFVPVGVATKLLVSLGVGLLVGFEREWSHKDLGVRTFSLVSLLGMLTTLTSPPFAWIGMAAVVLLVTALNIGNMLRDRPTFRGK